MPGQKPKPRSLSRPDARVVYAAATPQDSLAALDRKLGFSLGPIEAGGPPHLSWYQRIQDTPIEQLSDEDFTIAVVQAIHLPVLIPLGVRRIETNPTAGFLFEGQLLSALVSACALLREGVDVPREDLLRTLMKIRPSVAPTVQTSVDEAIHEVRKQISPGA